MAIPSSDVRSFVAPTIPISLPTRSHDRAARHDALPDTSHRDLDGSEFWRAIPGYAEVDAATFDDPKWQMRSSVTTPRKLLEVLGDRAPAGLIDELTADLSAAPMSIRLSPYTLSLIDWQDPWSDPIRRQFLPLSSARRPDHPLARVDSLGESHDSPVPGLVHRYPDKVLFLALTTCPVYCRYCTRSYAVGLDTPNVGKARVSAHPRSWEACFEYIAAHPQIEDVVVSGGDVWQLRADAIRHIGDRLLAIPHVRRIRYASKGLAVLPMKITGDPAFADAITDVARRGRMQGTDVVVHTHIAHPREITTRTQAAARLLFERGVTVRNQCVLMRGVNDDPAVLQRLVRRLGHIQVQPYYIYQHDFIPGVEDLRTPLSAALELEKIVRGSTAGFNTPTFVVDLPGGGGKRDAHSFEHYDRRTGIAVYSSPNVDSEVSYLYFDPLDALDVETARRWLDPRARAAMIRRALRAAGALGRRVA